MGDAIRLEPVLSFESVFADRQTLSPEAVLMDRFHRSRVFSDQNGGKGETLGHF
jgi:hypothetical protein